MQRRRSKKPWIVAAVAVLLAGGFAFLLLKDVPAPKNHIEKPLDSAKFLKPKG